MPVVKMLSLSCLGEDKLDASGEDSSVYLV